ncbi:MAG: hypothetical protein E5W49_07740, partial [Mesorhizobium sp.]
FVHGMLVQLPMPRHIDMMRVIEAAVAPYKDVDGFHPENVGRLTVDSKARYFTPCTPARMHDSYSGCGGQQSRRQRCFRDWSVEYCRKAHGGAAGRSSGERDKQSSEMRRPSFFRTAFRRRSVSAGEPADLG